MSDESQAQLSPPIPAGVPARQSTAPPPAIRQEPGNATTDEATSLLAKIRAGKGTPDDAARFHELRKQADGLAPLPAAQVAAQAPVPR